MTAEQRSLAPDAITTNRLTKHYGERAVVNNLTLRVPTGSVYALLGRNGAGKSTAIKMLMGLVRPDYGSATLLGRDAATLPPEMRQRIAYLAEGHPLYSWMTVREMVRFTQAFFPDWKPSLVEQILDHFELPARQKIRRLSRGQQAQLSLALALAPDPELLVMDDPTLGLDTIVRRDFLESLVELIQRRGRTVLFSSHILGDVERIADRIGILVDGALRVDCPIEVFKQRVRRVVVEFGRQPPALPDLPGVVGRRTIGTRVEIVVVGFGDVHEQALRAQSPLALDVIELNLEDAFIDYTRGPRKPLPPFLEPDEHDTSARVQGAA